MFVRVDEQGVLSLDLDSIVLTRTLKYEGQPLRRQTDIYFVRRGTTSLTAEHDEQRAPASGCVDWLPGRLEDVLKD